jgi:DNA-binding FadR family transcriptional regulator
MSATDHIRIPKAAELVADTLRRRIITGEYAPDELLPSETALMQNFNVARTTVRDAVRILESEGLLVVRRGANGGGRVQVPSVAMVADHAALILQFRGTTLEDVHAARARLRAALEAEAAALDDPVQLAVAEGRFHQQLVSLSDSVTISLLSAVANRIIAQQVSEDIAERGSDAEVLRQHHEAHRAHERLVDFIAVGAAREAETLWRQHLEAGMQYYRGAPTGPKSVVDVLS